MPKSVIKFATYEDLHGIPDNMIGEIVDGELIVTPRPSRKHGLAATVLGSRLTPPYYFGESGGPGGWVFIIEPEISFGANIIVPDLAGWRRDKFPEHEDHNWISVAPDWVCEIISPSTAKVDKADKLPIYAKHGVSHLWLIDPDVKTLDVFRLESGKWLFLGTSAENDCIRAEPFLDIEIALGDLWLE